MSIFSKIAETEVKVLENNPKHKKIEVKKEAPGLTAKHIEEHTPSTETIQHEEVKVSFVMNGFVKQARELDSLLRSNQPLNGIPGGKAQGMAPTDFPEGMLRKGVKIEHEHTPSTRKALEIAMDHTKEFPNYYAKLPAFERNLERLKEKS